MGREKKTVRSRDDEGKKGEIERGWRENNRDRRERTLFFREQAVV